MGNQIIYLSLIIQLVGLTLAVIVDPYLAKKQRRNILAVIIIVATLIVQEYYDFVLSDDVLFSPYRPYIVFLGYALRPMLILLLCHIVNPEKKHIIPWVLVFCNATVYFISLFNGMAFYIDENNHFFRGPLGYTCHFLSAILLTYYIIGTVLIYRKNRFNDMLFLFFNVFLVVGGIVADLIFISYTISCFTVCVVTACVFHFVWLHFQFVRAHESALLAEQRIKIMMSQIQPHFMYNTLATIQALCRTDPVKASEVTEKFGIYLRQNINSLNSTDLIPLGKELEHTQIYADIEMIRFPRIKVEYDIEDENLFLPALTIQPLVENSIRHGVRGRKDGLVTVTTRRNGRFHIIKITDNGVGFNVSEAFEKDETHIGLRNVRERIIKMCGGTVVINSSDNGTEIIITIPDKEE